MRGTAETGISYLKRIVVVAALLALSSAVLVAGAKAKAYQVIGTGGTLHVRTAPSLGAGTVGEMGDGTWIDIVCQTTGDNVVGSNIWDQIDSPYVGYVADWYATTPAVGKYSQELPVCGSGPTPQPTPQPTPPQPQPQPTPSQPQYTQLRNRTSVRCLDADRKTIGSNGTKVHLWDCWGGSNQNWLIGADGTIRNQASGRCLDADTGTIRTNGTKVQLWDCNGQANQRWAIGADGTIRNQASGRTLDANAGTINANGTKVQLWGAWGGRNQTWYSASPAALPQSSSFKYCAPKTAPRGSLGPLGTDITFEPCISVSDIYDGTSAARRSVQPSACPADAGAIAESMTCSVTKTGSRWNGTANVDYVTMNVLWDRSLVIIGFRGQSFATTTLDENLVTLEVATSPSGHPTSSEHVALTSEQVISG
jgi:hypothetical protein